jgi:transketolase
MTTKTSSETALASTARRLRREIVQMIGEAGSGHPGGSLSAIDLIASLYFRHLRHDPKNPDWPDRDRFVLSKGHGAPALYAALAQAGYFPPEQLRTLRKLGSPLQGHPEKGKLAGVEASTGSLGQGISIGIGMALAAWVDRRDYRVYVLIGDGEADEGQVWEGALFAAHHKVDNLTVIMDCNGQQLDSWVKEILSLEPIAEKWRAFGWHAIEIDGHNLGEIDSALTEAKQTRGRPTVIVARTVKGKGVSFMENNIEFHGMAPTAEQVEAALKELA